MVCQRCRGFLVCETFDELRRDTDLLHTRCIKCGCIEDAVVRTNRLRPLRGMRATPCGRGRKGDGKHMDIYMGKSTSFR